jgi:hypothetical protein
VKSSFEIKITRNVLLRQHNILSEPSYFQVTLEAEIVLRTVRRSALSENIPICVGSESGASVTVPSIGKRLYAKQE